MASRLSFCATPTRITLGPLTRFAHPSLASGLRAASSSGPKSTGKPDPASEEAKAKAVAKAEAKAAAAERAREAEERWIKKLKAEHGAGWKDVFEESQARKERNAQAIREGHRRAKLARQQQS